ncbi:hypothetical protein KP509_23G030100 [Ceratopteris richardii]|uniref:RRM domain-containing protein n=1 Tax=Ceratopteris richardii TaxID=49495 RepID=A0A8T2S0Q3_CERRI|nr:hypothetical protein KP509_23G030100 [Ceratopteris richardii]
MAVASFAAASSFASTLRAESRLAKAALYRVSASISFGSLSSSFTRGKCPLRLQAPSSSCPKFLSILTKGSPAACKRFCTIALDPDFYKIPHEEGIPQGSKLKLYNLPPTDDREKLKRDLIDWFVNCEAQDEPVVVTNFEYTDDPEWNEKGVGAFVEFGSKWQAVTVYARLDASKFQGRYVRMNFVERKPFPPEWIAKNAKWFRDDSKRNLHKIFVGNLSWSVDDAKLQNLFAQHGTVYDAKVMTDRETGRSRGFGFVTMSTEEEMNKAIEALHNFQFEGRTLRVNQAAAKPAAQ